MGLLVIYALFVTFYAVGMTIEYAKVTGYRNGYDKGQESLKKRLDDIEWQLSGWNETK
tara:strand:- start:456 stop:629 length:174 start_codon:yes stop_codon:yes gene_type:complete